MCFSGEVFGSGEDDPNGEFGIFLLKLMEIIEKNSSYCISIVLGFKECLGVVVYENFGEFWMHEWGVFLGKHPLNW